MTQEEIADIRYQLGIEALRRLCKIALGDSGQCRKGADFLLAWYNAGENGGWDPTDLWSLDTDIADDILRLLPFIRESGKYPNDLGFNGEIAAIWELWRKPRRKRKQRSSPRPSLAYPRLPASG